MKLSLVFRVKNVRCQNMPEFTSVRSLLRPQFFLIIKAVTLNKELKTRDKN